MDLVRGITVCCLLGVMGGSGFGAEGENVATYKTSRQKFNFKKFVAVRGESYGEKRIIVLATAQPVPKEELEKVGEKDAQDNVDAEVDQPYLKAVFEEGGELKALYGQGGGLSFGKSGEGLEGKATITGERIQGEVRNVEEGDFAREVTMKFDLPIGIGEMKEEPVKLEPPVKPSVSGTYTAGGKGANLKFVTVQDREEFGGKEAIRLVFTEQDPKGSKDPQFDAGFGKFGNALILSVDTSGGIFGCEVAHKGHSKAPFSAIGVIRMEEFDLSTGNAIGKVTTGGEDDFFGETWSAELTFAAPLTETMRKAMVEGKPKKEEEKKTAKTKSSKKKKKPAAVSEEMEEEESKGSGIAVKKLALPEGAKKVEYKKLVEHIIFETDKPVKETAEAFSKSLAGQGWEDGAGGLIGVKNAILKKEQGEANLTIMISPTATGSLVKIFTEGLDWSAAEKSSKKPAKEEGDKTVEEIEKEAQKQIDEALKGLPKDVSKDLLKDIFEDKDEDDE